jgi:aminoglycoside phosphotransferase (APT) family kinase protein
VLEIESIAGGGLDVMVLQWVAGVLACGEVTVLRGMREGGSPWLLRAGDRAVVLRVGGPDDAPGLATEVAALPLAGQAGVPVPQLLGHDDGSAAGVPLILTGRLPGTSRIPREIDPPRLRALGAVAARLHAVPLEPSVAMPARHQPIGSLDFAGMRRQEGASSLLREAEAAISRIRPAASPSVFVHGDLWHGNTLWTDQCLSGIVDWDCAGAGAPGVDIGSLRCDAALCFGTAAAADVLRGWEETAARTADDVAYWDAVAALASPPDLGWFPAAIADQGRPDLDRAALLSRRDSFLRAALEQLA